jgi:hypothetical protein
MQYNEIISLIETACEAYKGRLPFGYGTLAQLNADDDRYYPMVWLSTVTQGAPIANNGIKQQVFTLTLHVVQSGSVQQNADEDVTMYNETLAIANGLISKLYKTFDDDNNSFNQLQSGTLTQMFRTQDSVHIGWQFTITINTVWQDDCCADFE